MSKICKKLFDIGVALISRILSHSSNMHAIMADCGAICIPLIEDAEQSLSTTWNDAKVRTPNAISCYSFQSYNLIDARGGGIFITDDAD